MKIATITSILFMISSFHCFALQTTYKVGPDWRLKELSEVPWLKLDSGDEVQIAWREEPYRAKIGLRCRGTEKNPVRITGIKGPKGQLPIISGKNAVSGKYLKNFFKPKWDEPLGVIVIKRGRGDRWGYKPSHIIIENLKIVGANNSNSYISVNDGEKKYSDGAAAIWAVLVEHLTIRNCEISDNGNGIFVLSKNNIKDVSRNILIENNYIHGNGTAGSYRQHNVYTQAAGLIFQYNRVGKLRKKAKGSAIKDRSSGTVIRYNLVESGARTLDLVETDDSYDVLTKEPDYHETYVYGNILINNVDLKSGYPWAGSMIHFGGDTGRSELYKKGPLYFFHNTIIIKSDVADRYRISVFDLQTNEQEADIRNNIIYRDGTSKLLILRHHGVANLTGTNWINPDWKDGRFDTFDGKVKVVGKLITGKNPILADIEKGDYHPGKGSPCLDTAPELPDEIAVEHNVTKMYKTHTLSVDRTVKGEKADLGAFEANLK